MAIDDVDSSLFDQIGPGALTYAKSAAKALAGIDPGALEPQDRLLYSIAASLVSLASSGNGLGNDVYRLRSALAPE